jgi:uncharacterized protein involved in exopolysaccharide biosynthesis
VANYRPRAASTDMSLLALGVVVLRRHGLIALLAVVGALLGAAVGILSPRQYESSATFIPQDQSETNASGLAAAASQLGFRVPTTRGTWGPPVYVEVLTSRGVLDPIAMDTVSVAEEHNRRAAVVDLIGVPPTAPAKRSEAAAKALRRIINVDEDKNIGAVKLSVRTPWPSVSLELAQRLVRGANAFNLEVRKSQAQAEREFVEGQVAEATSSLRLAEDRLQAFLTSNRVAGSPELVFTRERLQRDVDLRQELQSSWLKSREDARIREVRNTPVVTVLEQPHLPGTSVARHIGLKTLLGALGGVLLGTLTAVLGAWLSALPNADDPEERELSLLLRGLAPAFLRRRWDRARPA